MYLPIHLRCFLPTSPLPLTSLQTRNLGVEPVVCYLRLVGLSWFATFPSLRPMGAWANHGEWRGGECCEGSVILLIDETGSA